MNKKQKQNKKNEKDIENMIEKNIEGFIEGRIENFVTRIASPFALIIFNIVAYVFFNYYYQSFRFFTDDFIKVLPLLNISIVVSFILATTRFFIYNKRYDSFCQLVGNVFFFLVAYKVWQIFPLDTSVIGNPETWDKIIRLIIVLTVIATIIGSIVDFGKLFSIKDNN